MTNTFTSIDQLPITLCAEEVALVLGISRAGAYTLMRSQGFPTIRIGKRMVVPKDKLLAWMSKLRRKEVVIDGNADVIHASHRSKIPIH